MNRQQPLSTSAQVLIFARQCIAALLLFNYAVAAWSQVAVEQQAPQVIEPSIQQLPVIQGPAIQVAPQPGAAPAKDAPAHALDPRAKKTGQTTNNCAKPAGESGGAIGAGQVQAIGQDCPRVEGTVIETEGTARDLSPGSGQKTEADLLAEQERRRKAAQAHAAKTQAERKKRQQESDEKDAAEQKAHEAFKEMRKKTQAARDGAGEKNRAEWAAGKEKLQGIVEGIKKEDAKTAEQAAWNKKLGSPLWCNSDKAKAYCKKWGYGGKCESGVCSRSKKTIDPNLSKCTYNYDCSNINYEGLCLKGKCRSVTREKCGAPGRVVQCMSLDGSRTGGTAICGSDGYVGDCLYSLKSYKKRLAELNKGQAIWDKRKVKAQRAKANVDPAKSPCVKHYECNNGVYEGYCSHGTCTSIKRESCSSQGSMALCFAMDGSRTAGIAVCGKGNRNDCVSRKNIHSAYHNILKDYSKKGAEWDKYLSGIGPNNQTLDASRSPCKGALQCSNQNYEGWCLPSGTCRTEKRKSCAKKGRVQACVSPFSGEIGLRMCQPKGLGWLAWGDCYRADRYDSGIRNLKRQGKWKNWGR
jgi:hypothetical protein